MTETEGPSPDAPVRAPRWKKRVVRIVLLTMLAAVVYTGWQTLSIHSYGFRDDGRKADCAIVLGTAAWHNKPSPVFEERLNHAIKLYQEGRVKALVLTGGRGKGAPFAEAQVAYDYCVKQGVPKTALFREAESRTTTENLSGAKEVLDREGLKSALIVSDPWHLKRGVLIAKRQGIDASQSGTKTTRFESFRSRTSFLLRELYLYHVFLVFGK